MANIAQLLAAIANLPQIQGGPPLMPTTFPQDIQAPESVRFPMPEPPPAAPSMPIDRSIIEEYLKIIGPPPTAPGPPPQLGTLGKIGLALQGFSQGFQGNAPQFLAQLRAERERPQREYESRLDDYNARRQRLGERGLEAARDVEEKRQARTQATADRQFELEVRDRARKLGIEDERAMAMFKDAMLADRQAKDDARQLERQQAAQQAQQQRDARTFAARYRAAGAKEDLARELGEYDAGLREELSPAAAKWESAAVKLQEVRAQRTARLPIGGGRGGGGASSNTKVTKALQQFNEAKDEVKSANLRGDSQAEALARKRMNTTLTMLSRFPAQVQIDYDETGMWPTARVKTASPQPTQAEAPLEIPADFRAPGFGPQPTPRTQFSPGKTVTMAQVRASAKKAGVSEQEAARQFRDAGYAIQ